MTIETLKPMVEKIHKLLEDPQPGLFAYNNMLCKAMDELVEAWIDEKPVGYYDRI